MTLAFRQISFIPIVLISVFILWSYNGLAGAPKSNYSILDSLTRSAGGNVVSFLREQSIDSCGLMLSVHPAAWLLRQELVSSKKIRFFEGNSSQKHLSEIQIQDCAVRYFLYSDSGDSLVREAQLLTKGIFHKAGALIEIPQFSAVIRDTIARDDVSIVEIPAYPFTKAPIPEQPKGFFSEIAEPVLFVAAAAVTVLLLFTVRSQ